MSFRVAIAFVALAFALAGCSSGSDLQPGYQEHLDNIEHYEESEEYLQDQGDYYYEQQRADDFAARGWRCYWDPTINDDWHDDYLCSNGANYDRPYLLPGDSFVEGWEIDAAAAEYENSLNQ